MERAADRDAAGDHLEGRQPAPRANAVGLIPSWAKDPKVGFSSFNARADGVDTKPAFKGAWAKGRRCLIVTAGFYEWKKLDPKGKEKQPYAVSLGNRGPMLMAGLWEPWKSPMGWIRSCTIITTDANTLLAEVHDRMPAIIGPDDYAPWLGEEPAAPDRLKAPALSARADDHVAGGPARRQRQE
jgi:putative SOS response-associated peptidase YedK